jgi:hypothetical protein
VLSRCAIKAQKSVELRRTGRLHHSNVVDLSVLQSERNVRQEYALRPVAWNRPGTMIGNLFENLQHLGRPAIP